ncbi:MAG: mitofilin family membrane protein [Rhodospirillaceae bacterium]|nr:mitofilin family membrane protein [Rhodospirillaceae bacterium]
MDNKKENKNTTDKTKPAEKEQLSPPAETTPTSKGGAVWLVVFVLVIGVGGWAFWPEIGPSIKPIIAKVRGISKPDDFPVPPQIVANPPSPSNIEGEQSKIDAQNGLTTESQDQVQELAQAQEQPSQQAPQETQTGEQKNITNIEGALENIVQRLDAIEQRLGELEQRPQITRDPTSSAQALVLATTQLAARLSGEAPFVAELNVLEKVAGDDAGVMQAIGALKPHSEAGIPTVATLTARFKDLSTEIMRTRLRGSDNGWMGEIKDRIGGLIVVRRTDPATATDPVERALALADGALQVGALDEAVVAMKALEGDAGALAAPWLGDSDARLMAASALETLNNHALAKLGAATE